MMFAHLSIIVFCLFSPTYSMTKNEKVELRETVKGMFQHAYNSYMTHAYPADELMPLTCKGRYRDVEPSRGDVDDILGNFSMTLIDSLDSLVIFGQIQEFERGVKLVINNIQFDNDIVVSVFETNIRVVGGLLGAHVAADVLKKAGTGMAWYNDELLYMAKDMGERLLPAFNTTTGIPYPRVNLKYGIVDPRSRTGTESDTCTACAGTMIMEFGALSRLTRDPVFEIAADKAMKALWTFRSRTSDLVGTVINIHNGEWVRRDSGVGAGIDSYYEYCLKAYILLGEEDYLQRFNQHYKAVMRYINKDSLFLNVHMHNPTRLSYSYMDSLQAFWPGLQVLKGDLKAAIELHEVFYSVAKRHTFLPEAFTTNFEVHWGQHLLRPELVESTYFLYEATNDPYYLEVGKYIVENLNRYTKVPCGFAAVKDVRTLSHEDRMDSFLLSETLKYLYLLFADKDDLVIDIHDFVFTTEAHILPLGLSNWNRTSSQNNIYQSEHLHDHSCPSTTREGSMMSFAGEIRRKSRSKATVHGKCTKQDKDEASFVVNKNTSPPPLRAEQFIPGNAVHLQILKSMGISVTETDDGKVQLMQNAAVAETSEMAGEGIRFMQSMMELAKFRSEDGGAENLPRVVQILSSPYNGNIVLNAGPAQFGVDLSKTEMGVSAEVVLAEPFNGCTALSNRDLADHRIVVMERGECMFIDKVRQAESYGAVGVIIIDNNGGSSSESQPMFAMSGDGSNGGINIPAVFLFSNEGEVMQKAMQIVTKTTGGNLRVRVANKAIKIVMKNDQDQSTQFAETDNQGQETPKQESPLTGRKSEQQTKTSFQRCVRRQPETSEDGEKAFGDMNKINKLIEIMKNVVNQNGFEYEGKRIKNKAATEGKSTSVGRTTTSGWLDDMMMSKLKADEYIEDFLLRRKAAEKADLDAIAKTDREKKNGAADEEKTASAEIDARDSISKGQKMSANFEDVIKTKKEARGVKVCFTTMQVSHEEPAQGIEEDSSTTEEVTSSVANEGDGETPDRGNEQLLEKDTELEGASQAENERTSEEELNTEGYSDSQRKNVEDLHVERSAGEEVTGEEVTGGAPSDEELTTKHYADTQKQNSFTICSKRAPRTSANQQFSQKIAEARIDSDEGRSDDTDTPSYAGENNDHVDVDDAYVNTLSESRDEIIEEVQPPG